MSIQQISPAAVLHALQAGARTMADLADKFEVLPSSLFLADAVGTLIAHDQVRRLPNGDLIPHDLFDTQEDR